MVKATFETNLSNTNNQDGKNKSWASGEDDTEMAGANRERNVQEEHEILVKWQLPGNHDTAGAKRQLTQLIAELLMCFPDTTLIDHKKREWIFTAGDTEDKFLPAMDKAAFQLHPIKNKMQKIARWITITKFRTSSSISAWKNNDYFNDQVIETKTYLFSHPFGHHEWDITSIGFIKDIHAVHYNSDYLHKTINDAIKVHDKNPPIFQLIPQKITNQDKTATTRAYTVQCTKDEAKRMSQLFTKGELRTTQMFIPFRYKRSQPELFTRCIKQQNEVYYKTWIIKLEGISEEIMHFIHNEITIHQGVFHVVPSKRYTEIGEWKILVDQNRSSFIHRQLQSNWANIMTNVPTNFTDQTPAGWSVPRISSKKIRDYQDESSDNDSYGSLLTSGTNESIMTYGDESLHELPTEYQFQSYAEATAPPAKTVTATSTASPTTSDLTEWQKDKVDLEIQLRNQVSQLAKFQTDQETMIRALQEAQTKQIEQLKTEQSSQIEQLQADIQAKVSRSRDLEDQLAQAIELAFTRNKREDEMLHKLEQREAEMFKKFETMMSQITSNTGNPDMEIADTFNQIVEYEKPHKTPPRSNTSKESPPPKKANTNSSPQRHVYPVFRNPSEKPPKTTTSKDKTNQKLLTQPMDSDDDNNPPAPVANLGAKFE